jgi:sporulation protein YlmC with PRC-barrel domain
MASTSTLEKIMSTVTSPVTGLKSFSFRQHGRAAGLMLGVGSVVALAWPTTPALPQAGVTPVQVDLNVVAKGYRVSKLLGSAVYNDKNEKIGSLDDIISHNKQLSFVVLQVGGFLGVGVRLVVVPYENLNIDENGTKITLPGASKDELKKLSEFQYRTS